MKNKTVRIDIGDGAKEVLKTAGITVVGIASLCVAYRFGYKVAVDKVTIGLHALERVEPGFVGHVMELTKKHSQLYRK